MAVLTTACGDAQRPALSHASAQVDAVVEAVSNSGFADSPPMEKLSEARKQVLAAALEDLGRVGKL